MKKKKTLKDNVDLMSCKILSSLKTEKMGRVIPEYHDGQGKIFLQKIELELALESKVLLETDREKGILG